MEQLLFLYLTGSIRCLVEVSDDEDIKLHLPIIADQKMPDFGTALPRDKIYIRKTNNNNLKGIEYENSQAHGCWQLENE